MFCEPVPEVDLHLCDQVTSPDQCQQHRDRRGLEARAVPAWWIVAAELDAQVDQQPGPSTQEPVTGELPIGPDRPDELLVDLPLDREPGQRPDLLTPAALPPDPLAGLMLIDQAGALQWAGASDGVVEARSGDLSVPVQIGGGPVGTLDVYVADPRDWDDSAMAALQTYAGLVASLLVAAVAARTRGRLADQLQSALEHRSVIEQAVEMLVNREGLDAEAALEWLGTAARSSGCTLVEMARAVVGGAPLPSERLAQAKGQRREATDLEVAGHRQDSELHEGAARRYERRGQAGRAQTERLQAAAARGRIIDAEAERRRADQQP